MQIANEQTVRPTFQADAVMTHLLGPLRKPCSSVRADGVVSCWVSLLIAVRGHPQIFEGELCSLPYHALRVGEHKRIWCAHQLIGNWLACMEILHIKLRSKGLFIHFSWGRNIFGISPLVLKLRFADCWWERSYILHTIRSVIAFVKHQAVSWLQNYARSAALLLCFRQETIQSNFVQSKDCQPVIGCRDWGFLIFQMRPLKGSAMRIAFFSVSRSVSTALKPLP